MGHVHRYAAFFQTVENSFAICNQHLQQSQVFPEHGRIDSGFYGSIETIFEELFPNVVDDDGVSRQFLITDAVVTRAIDLVTGLFQQMKLLMDDTNAPTWNGSLNRPAPAISSSDRCSVPKADHGKKAGKTATGLSSRLRFLAMEMFV